MAKSGVPTIADRLRAAQEARQTQSERAKAAAASPDVAKRREAREAIVEARNLRIAARRADEQARKEREAAERAAAEAEAAASRAAALQAE
jgi:dTMP kinase